MLSIALLRFGHEVHAIITGVARAATATVDGGGVADERKATTQAWRWGRDRAVLMKSTIRMARRVDKLHEGFVRAKARTKPTNRDND